MEMQNGSMEHNRNTVATVAPVAPPPPILAFLGRFIVGYSSSPPSTIAAQCNELKTQIAEVTLPSIMTEAATPEVFHVPSSGEFLDIVTEGTKTIEGAQDFVMSPLFTKPKPVESCYCCGKRRYWKSAVGGQITCGTCHPPVSSKVVAEWIGEAL